MTTPEDRIRQLLQEEEPTPTPEETPEDRIRNLLGETSPPTPETPADATAPVEPGPALPPGPGVPQRLDNAIQGLAPGPEAQRSLQDLITRGEPGTTLGPGGPIARILGPTTTQNIETGLDVLDTASIPFESAAENLFRSFTGIPQDIRSILGQEEARQPQAPFQALETFRDRPWWQQLAIGAIDPTLGTSRLPQAARGAQRAAQALPVDPGTIREVPRPLPQPVREPAPSMRAGVFGEAPPAPPIPEQAPIQPVPEQQAGAMQSSMGFGEQVPQGQLFPESPTQAQRQPLADPEQLSQEAARQEEIAQGQTEFPLQEVEPPASPLEQARRELDEATANLESEQAPGQRAPKFGTPERAEFDRLRREQARTPKRQRVQQARARVREARQRLQQEENALAQRQMDTADAVRPPFDPGSLRVLQEEPTSSITPSGDVMEGGLQEILGQFREVLNNPARADEWKETLLMRTQERGRRAANFENQVDALVSQGVPTEEAINIATRELGGELPSADTPLHQLATPYVREALFQEVYTQLANEPLEMRATATALANALAGNPIPRTPGIRGGSAFSRLQRVFGEELTGRITRERSLEEVIALETRGGLGLTRPRGPSGPRAEFPSTQTFGSPETTRLLPDEPPLGEVQQPLRPEPPLQGFPERPPDPRTPEQRQMDLQFFREQTGEAPTPTGPSFRTDIPEEALLRQPERPLLPEAPPQGFPARPRDPRPQAQQEIDLQIFREMTGEADAPTGISPQLRAKMADIPPDDVIRQFSFLPETQKERMLRWARNAGLTAMDFSNLVRANLATVDLSYLRQQALLIPGNPVEFTQSFRDALRSIFSAEYSRNIDHWMRSDPDFRYYDELGLDFLRAEDSRVAQDWQRAEDFIVQGGNRPLQRLANRIPWINVSARAYVTGMNSMNWRIFKGHMRMMHHLAEEAAAGRATLPNNFDLNRSARQMGAMLADFSGRGPLSGRVLGQDVDIRSTAPFLNALFFSARLNVGRLLTPRHLWASDKFVRQAAWKNMLTGVGTIGGIVKGGEIMGWWDTELDPRSSDFLKPRIGNTRIDPWGGFQQFAVLTWRLISTIREENMMSTTGQGSFAPPEQLLGRFARSKLAPGISQSLMAFTGRDFLGSQIDRRDWQFWLRENTPIAVQDVMTAYEDEGLLGVGLSLPAFFGVGVQTFGEEEPQQPRGRTRPQAPPPTQNRGFRIPEFSAP